MKKTTYRQKQKKVDKPRQLIVVHDDITHPFEDEWKCKYCKQIKDAFEKEFIINPINKKDTRTLIV